MWICPNCKSDNVDAKSWININTREVNSLTDSKDDEDYWCNNCEQHLKPILKNDTSTDKR